MKISNLFFYLAIILMSVSTVRGQVPSAEYDRLDSILLSGNPQAAKAYWLTVCNHAIEDSPAMACGVTAKQLQNLLDFVASLQAQTPAYIEQIIAGGKSQSSLHRESYAGPFAARAFQSFLVATERDNWSEAIIHLRTARYFKISFLKRTLAEAHNQYAQALKYYREDTFDSADSVLKAILYDAGNHRHLKAYTDTISYLQQRVDRKLQEVEKQKYNWERTASVDSRLSFSLSASLIGQPGSDAFRLLMSNADTTIQVEVARVVPTYRFGLGLQFWYELNSRTSVGGGLEAAKFAYSSIHTTQLIFFDFDVAYSRAFVGGKYLLRSEVGLRPYLSLGLGVMQYKYDQINSTILRTPSYSQTYQVAAGDFTYGEATFTIGTQLVPKSSSRWATSWDLSWYIPFGEHSFLPMPRMSASMRLDLLL